MSRRLIISILLFLGVYSLWTLTAVYTAAPDWTKPTMAILLSLIISTSYTK